MNHELPDSAAADRRPVWPPYHWLMQSFGFFAGATFAAMAVIIVINVVARNAATTAAPWVVEVSEYGLALATFLGAPWVLYQGSHVRIDVLAQAAPAAIARGLEAFTDALGALLCAAFTYFMASIALEAYQRGTMLIKALVIPEWWTLLAPILCFALLTVEFARRLWRALSTGEA